VWPRRTTVALGISLLLHLCFVMIWFANGDQPADTLIPVLLAVWAAAMGLQSGAVRRLNVGGSSPPLRPRRSSSCSVTRPIPPDRRRARAGHRGGVRLRGAGWSRSPSPGAAARLL